MAVQSPEEPVQAHWTLSGGKGDSCARRAAIAVLQGYVGVTKGHGEAILLLILDPPPHLGSSETLPLSFLALMPRERCSVARQS